MRRTNLSRAYAVSVLTLVALLSAHPARAQIFESVGIRAQGMGGAFVAVADDATGSWWNPAGVANGAYFNSLVEWNFGQDPVDARARAFAVSYPALGLSYYRLALQGVLPRPAGGPSVVSADQGLNYFGATVGQSLSEHLVVASTVKLVHALGETGGDVDLGTMAALGPMRLGLTLKNLVRPEFSGGGAQLELPRQARVGVAFNAGPAGRPRVVLAIDADLTSTPTPLGDARHLATGIELWGAERRIALRAGAGLSTTGDVREFGSLGTSLAVRAGLYADLQVTRGQDDIRNGWGIGLRVTF